MFPQPRERFFRFSTRFVSFFFHISETEIEKYVLFTSLRLASQELKIILCELFISLIYSDYLLKLMQEYPF